MSTPTFKELLTTLSVGKLSNLPVFGNADGEIPKIQHKRILAAVNTARTSLFTRFKIWEKEIGILAQAGKSVYYLRPEFAFNSGIINAEKYLIDTPEEPFLGGLARVDYVYNPRGELMRINDMTEPSNSVFFPSNDSVRLVDPKEGDVYSITYRAMPLFLDLKWDEDQHDDFELFVPDTYQELFLLKIAATIYSQMDQKEHAAAGLSMNNTYESLCAEMLQNNTDLSAQSSSNVRFKQNGWV